MTWTAQDIPNQNDQTAVVTGANTGIGFHTALELARAGGRVVLACRDMEKAGRAMDSIRAEVPAAELEAIRLDLADLASVRAFARDFRSRYARLDLLVNNAGIMMTPYGTTTDGFERQLGVNHLGHFALTGLLLESLAASARPVDAGAGARSGSPRTRVVTVASNAHRMGDMDFDRLQYGPQGYSPTRAYGRTKLANLLFTLELQRRFDAAGIPALAVAAHPGFAITELARHLLDRWYMRVGFRLFSVIAQSAHMGALPTLRAAVDPAAGPADYYGPDGFGEQRGDPVKVGRSKAARDREDARRLWEASEDLTGVAFLDTAGADVKTAASG